MFKIIITILFVGCLGSEGIFNVKNQCTCDQMNYQSDCTAKGSMCVWEGDSCSTLDCSKISDAAACAANLKCMWKQSSSGASCTTFTFCSQLQGSTQMQCLAISHNCPYTDGTYCGSANQLHSCSHFTASQYCEGYISNDGVCQWRDDTKCTASTSCATLNQSECSLSPYGCKYTSGACSQLICSDYTTQASCSFVMVAINKGDYQLCTWDSTASKCSSATNYGGLGQGNCIYQTYGTARWVSTSSGGECKACYAQMIFAIIMALFIIMI